MDYDKIKEELYKKFGFIPHSHICEFKMLGLNSCPYTENQLKKECYYQCDNCDHMIYVVYTDPTCQKILFIERLQEQWFQQHPEQRAIFKIT